MSWEGGDGGGATAKLPSSRTLFKLFVATKKTGILSQNLGFVPKPKQTLTAALPQLKIENLNVK